MKLAFRLVALSLLAASSMWINGACAADRLVPPSRWSPSWMSSAESTWPQGFVLPTGMPPAFDHQTVRQSARLSVGGTALRITVSNEYSASPLRIGAASVGLMADPGTGRTEHPKAVTFAGHPYVVVPAGATATSDPVDFAVAPLTTLAVSVFLPGASAPGGFHWLAQGTVHVAEGDQTSATSLPSNALKLTGRAFLGTISVLGGGVPHTVAAIGDSLTDGVGATPDADRRWPDALAEELAGQGIGVLNAGIAGGRLLRNGMGLSALARIENDAFQQPGLEAIVVQLGTNDIGWPGGPFAPADTPMSPQEFIDGYRQLIAKARVHNIRIIAVTVPPFKDALQGTPLEGHYSEAKERTRQAVNKWIRECAEFDAVADADRALRDAADRARLAPEFDSGDHLHPSDAGHRAIAHLVAQSLRSAGARSNIVSR
ncbi:SGNH/GDSL hydrolase family protein [Ramlibacter sp.]|uniref:SGNH/GDSL hydrolase family protein n=1 Tax=Ramlibacter sp. TaxID=1917967 RepID=UPI0017BFFC59|nr:SGNH/GDSL hydrolase family protein [Ramlibacter sp.]MBA2672367.1 SGNH/GDSL hydrolase family protein [Ramlibacter sp.]